MTEPIRQYAEILQEALDGMERIVQTLSGEAPLTVAENRDLESELLAATAGAVVVIARAQIEFEHACERQVAAMAAAKSSSAQPAKETP